MAYNIDTIRTNLKTLLQTVTEIAFVYDRRNPNIEGYPAIIFDITKTDNEMLTNTQNIRTLTFTLYIIVEVGTQGIATANNLLDIATKKIVEAVEKIDNLSLSGTVDWIIPLEGSREEVQTPQGLSIWQKLDLRVQTTSSII